jgi:hypothetical protein
MLNQEFDFKLPIGLTDSNGELQNQGKIKLMTAKDELIVQNLASRDRQIDIVFWLLAQAIAKLGNINQVIPSQLEQLFLADFEYLQNLFAQIQPQNVNSLGE